MAIDEDRIDILKEYLSKKIDKSKAEIIVDELFAQNQSPNLKPHDFVTVESINTGLYNDMVRLLIALYINGNYEKLRGTVSVKLVDVAKPIADNIEKEANGYPSNSSSIALIWTEGAGLRAAFNLLAYYYRQRGMGL